MDPVLVLCKVDIADHCKIILGSFRYPIYLDFCCLSIVYELRSIISNFRFRFTVYTDSASPRNLYKCSASAVIIIIIIIIQEKINVAFSPK